MLIFIIRTGIRLGIGFISILVYMNILGKMQLAPRSAMDQIGNYVVGGIIGGIIYNMDLPLWKFFIAIIIWGSLMLIMNYIKVNNLKAKRVIEGNPILLIDNGKINFQGFADAKMSSDDLISRIHQLGIPSITALKSVWLETNGQITVVKVDDDVFAWSLIEDGQINHIEMRRSYKSDEWLLRQVNNLGVEKIEDVFYGELLKGNMILYLYDGQIINESDMKKD